MCGIYGYVGGNAVTETLKGIKRLEYRGYDSSGVAFIDYQLNIEENNKNYAKNIKKGCKNLFSIREKGEIKYLEEILKNLNIESEIAIAHTRWATHGMANIENAHPHFSQNGKWAVVHNGIIENYLELKNSLKNVKFASQTDTEVVAQLLEKMDKGKPLVTLRDVCKCLMGSYAIGVIYTDSPDKIYVARRNSPALVGIGENCGVVCSDINSIEGVNEAYLLDEENLAIVSKGSVEIYDFNLNKINGKMVEIQWRPEDEEDKRYPHFMLKEIQEIPEVLRKTTKKYQKIDDFNAIFGKNVLKDVEKLLIVGCGTAYNAGTIGGDNFEQECKIEVKTVLASELMSKCFLYSDKTLAVFVSQSGETADTLKAVNLCKENGIQTLAITNVKNSTISRLCDYVLYTYAGKEIAVASTKAFNCQVAVLFLFASYLKSIKENTDYVKAESVRLRRLANQIEALNIDEVCKEIAQQVKNEESVYMIGRGLDWLLAEESSLKLKEISYIHSEAFPAGELKHGTISLIEEGTKVFAFATNENNLSKMLSNIKEVQSRGAKVIALSQYQMPEGCLQVKLENIPEKYMPLYAVVYMQKVAYYTSLALGHNPDKPRSLAKSVTVE